MANIYYPPTELVNKTAASHIMFLAGSIELGRAPNWQQRVIDDLMQFNVEIFNPRRPNWDWNTPMSPTQPTFRQQVEWEQRYLARSDTAIFYFDGDCKSPVSLMELGQTLERQHWERTGAYNPNMFVMCPPSFWRHANVVITCDQYDIPVFDSYNHLIAAVKKHLRAL